MKSAEERFWVKVNKKGPLILKARCWIWTGSKNPGGYGTFSYKGKPIQAHRWSYEFHKGTILKGLDICHRCDVRACINPDHLFSGTRLDNMRDCAQKGRTAKPETKPRGEANGNSKLTDEQVLDIRMRPNYRGITYALAKEFNVARTSICNIRRGRTWKHV